MLRKRNRDSMSVQSETSFFAAMREDRPLVMLMKEKRFEAAKVKHI